MLDFNGHTVYHFFDTMDRLESKVVGTDPSASPTESPC
jgi:hypothetical protein